MVNSLWGGLTSKRSPTAHHPGGGGTCGACGGSRCLCGCAFFRRRGWGSGGGFAAVAPVAAKAAAQPAEPAESGRMVLVRIKVRLEMRQLHEHILLVVLHAIPTARIMGHRTRSNETQKHHGKNVGGQPRHCD
eukprot:s5440_g1.t1